MKRTLAVITLTAAIAANGAAIVDAQAIKVDASLPKYAKTSGVSGNLNDRLTREPGPFHGHVIDFLQVPWFAVFNVADIWITFAAITVIWLTMITQVNLAGERVPRPEKAGEGEPVEGPNSPAP